MWEKPLLVAQAGNRLAGHGYHAKDLGYKGLNKVLEDMPEYVRALNRCRMKTATPSGKWCPKNLKRKKRRKKSIRTISAFAISSRLHAGNLSRKIHHLMGRRHRAADAGNRLPNRGEEKTHHRKKEDTCIFPTGLKTPRVKKSPFFARNTRKNDTRPWALTRVYEGTPNPEDFSPTPAERANPARRWRISP